MSMQALIQQIESRIQATVPKELLDAIRILDDTANEVDRLDEMGIVIRSAKANRGIYFYEVLSVDSGKFPITAGNGDLPSNWVSIADVNGGDALVYHVGTRAFYVYDHEAPPSMDPIRTVWQFAADVGELKQAVSIALDGLRAELT